jgi:tetratricopeptide (TPR) repeat protein
MRATVLLAQNRLKKAEIEARRAAELARQTGDEEALARSLNVLATAGVMLGRPDSESHLREALSIHERRGDLADQSAITGNLGAMAWFEGRWDDAKRLYEQSAESALRAGDVVPAALAQANLGELLVAQGRVDEASSVLNQSLATLRAVGYVEGAVFAESQLGRAQALRGKTDEARATLTRLIGEVEGSTPTDAVDLASALAEAEVDAGDPARGLSLLEGALAAAGGDAGVYAAAAERVRTRALARLGRYDEAGAALDRAVTEATANGLGYERALLRLAQQELAVSSGQPVDPREIEATGSELRALGVLESHVSALVASAVGAQP